MIKVKFLNYIVFYQLVHPWPEPAVVACALILQMFKVKVFSISRLKVEFSVVRTI